MRCPTRCFYHVVLVACLVACSKVPPAWERTCETEGVSTIDLGGTILEVPSSLWGGYIKGNGPSLGNLSKEERANTRICPLPNGQTVEAQQISFFPLPDYGDGDGRRRMPVHIIISYRPEGGEDLYSQRNWESVEFQDAGEGFNSAPNGSVGMGAAEVFVQKVPTLRTPSGHPVMFGCYSGKSSRGRECFTWWHDKSGLQYEYSFHDGDFPRSGWLLLHEQVVENIAALKRENQ